MRAAILTTALVLLVLAIYAQGRVERRDDVASTPRVESPAVSSGPAAAEPSRAQPADAAGDAAPSYETATSESAPSEARRHVVKDGETLESIARDYYGDEANAVSIYEANRDQIRDPKDLRAGQTLIVP